MQLKELATLLAGRLEGDPGVRVERIAALDRAGAGDLAFLTDAKYARHLARTQAAAVLLPQGYAGERPAVPALFVADVAAALDVLLAALAPAPDFPPAGIDPSAVVDASVRLGGGVAVGPHVSIAAGVTIGSGTVLCPGCRIGRDATIGRDCILYANVVVNRGCQLGDRVIVHPNSTLGADGFGYRLVDGRHVKIPHIGIVTIEDDVEIGANSCVDRAKFGQTVVGRNTKIDNLVQVAHNVRIGPSCILVGQSGIGGSSELGRHVVLAGQAGVVDHVTIGDGAVVAAKSVVIGDLAPGARVMGVPSRAIQEFFRENILIGKLAGLFREVKQLTKRLETIESKDAGN